MIHHPENLYERKQVAVKAAEKRPRKDRSGHVRKRLTTEQVIEKELDDELRQLSKGETPR